MTKVQKNLIINIALLLLTGVVPLYIFVQYQNNYINIDLIQKGAFTVVLCGSILLAYLNNKNRMQLQSLKWLWILFEVLGVMGIIYSLTILGLIFMFRRGIGF